jgi:hypothetical protein
MTPEKVENDSDSHIPDQTWAEYYSSNFSKVNYSVHSYFSRSVHKYLPLTVSQYNIITVSLLSVETAVKKLKSSSTDCDEISALHLQPGCELLISHLQLLFQI